MVSRISKLLLLVLLVVGTIPVAHANEMAPVYQRGRGHHQGWVPWQAPGGYPFNFGFFGFPPQIYGGSWYQRPYPTHLDYFRLRSPVPAPAYGIPCVEDEMLGLEPAE